MPKRSPWSHRWSAHPLHQLFDDLGSGVRREVELVPSARCVRGVRRGPCRPPGSTRSPASTIRRASCCTGDAGSSSGWRRSGTVVIGAILAPRRRCRRNPFVVRRVHRRASIRSATVAAMGMRCSRVGCSGHAVASFCFDGRAALGVARSARSRARHRAPACSAPVTPTRSRRRGAGTSRTVARRTPRPLGRPADRRATASPGPTPPLGGRTPYPTATPPLAGPRARRPAAVRDRRGQLSARRRAAFVAREPADVDDLLDARRCWRARSPPRLRPGPPPRDAQQLSRRRPSARNRLRA